MTRVRVGTLVVVGLLAIAAAAMGQPSVKMPRIGVLSGSHPDNDACLRALQGGLNDLGHVEGKTHVLEVRWSQGRREPFAELARPGGNITGVAQLPGDGDFDRLAPVREVA